ncbi:GNAT family N-acetyltransferase [Marinomonas balearica]|uniref:GNAT family N-acetyltransferase n=1 Tax=Marinomonas balearica TaxID=491947 RepID=UPI001061549A|nr:GNAT family N-acetyltransferase [Marinomonas balearica]
MDEYIALDLLTLSKLSEEADRPIDVSKYRAALALAKHAGLLFECRKNSELRGYFTLRELTKGLWFVPMFVVHPNHRNKVVFWSLFSQLKTFITKHHVVTLISNVYRNNELSNNFHKKLGFLVTRENERGFEYTLEINETLRKKWQEV